MSRCIVHLQVPAFEVAVERVRDRSLRGRPVAVSPGRAPRAVITSISREAWEEGVRRGMRLDEARALCGGLAIVAPDPDLQRRALDAMVDLARAYSPLIEPHPDGRFFADLTGTTRLFGAERNTALRLGREMTSRLALPCRTALATNKLVSGVATRVGPPVELADIHPGDEGIFLSPLPAVLLPAVRPEREGELLADLNLRRVADLASLPLARLALAFRERAYALYRQARGRDEAPVRPPARQPEIHVEETLAEDTHDDPILEGFLFLLVQRAGCRLRAAHRAAAAARLAIRFADRSGSARRVPLRPGEEGDADLFARLRPVLAGLTARRVRVRWMGLTLAGLAPLVRQLPLFGSEAERRGPPLSLALDRLRSRYGEGSVRWLAPGKGRPED
jgi:DNA polymerase-4